MSGDLSLYTNLVGEFVVFKGPRQGWIRAVYRAGAGLCFVMEEMATGDFYDIDHSDLVKVIPPRRTAPGT